MSELDIIRTIRFCSGTGTRGKACEPRVMLAAMGAKP